jgi:hypothetical protein
MQYFSVKITKIKTIKRKNKNVPIFTFYKNCVLAQPPNLGAVVLEE